VLHQGQTTAKESIKQLNGLFLPFPNDCLLLNIVTENKEEKALANNYDAVKSNSFFVNRLRCYHEAFLASHTCTFRTTFTKSFVPNATFSL